MPTSHATPSTNGHQTPSGAGAQFSPYGDHPLTVPADGSDISGSLTEAVAARETERLEQEVEALRRRLATQPVIEQAKGVLMSHYGFGADAAFAALSRWSQYTNTKLYLLAGEVLEAASEPAGTNSERLEGFLARLPSPVPVVLPSEDVS